MGYYSNYVELVELDGVLFQLCEIKVAGYRSNYVELVELDGVLFQVCGIKMAGYRSNYVELVELDGVLFQLCGISIYPKNNVQVGGLAKHWPKCILHRRRYM